MLGLSVDPTRTSFTQPQLKRADGKQVFLI